jgi:kynureninase
MITIEADKSAADYPLLSTEYILSVIDKHANDTAVLLLPGIQFYTGQLFDIKTITAHAQSKGIFVICDLAHAAGNVPLQLHDWNVDAAAWCTYKYLNSGPGGMGSLFVHERNSYVHPATVDSGKLDFPNRLSGWWGNEKSGRFDMHNNFIPIRGAGGFQVSNPSAVDMTSVCASLELFNMTDMATIREKSLKITKYLEDLLVDMPEYKDGKLFSIITPRDPAQRGAQLSLLLQPGLLAVVMHELEERSVVLDERKPDVIRVAPAPLYNSYEDVWLFIQAFQEALKIAVEARDGGKKVEGTDELKQTT